MKKYSVGIFLLFLFWLGSASAQYLVIDSLRLSVKQSLKNPPSFARDTNLILQLASLSEALSNKVEPSALTVIDTLTDLVKKNKTWLRGQAVLERAKGKYHDRKAEYAEAYKHYLLANDLYQKVGYDIEGRSFCYILTGFLLNNTGKPEECIAYLYKAIPLAKKLQNTSNLCFIYDFLGDYNYYSSYKIQNYSKALNFYKLTETLLPKNKNPFHFADNPHGLANCYFRLGDEKLGNFYFEKAIKLADSLNQFNVLFATYDNIAEIFLDKKDYPKAILYAEKGLEYARKDKLPEFISRAENSVSEIYLKTGNYKEALMHFKAHVQLEDSLGRKKFNSEYEKLKIQNISDNQAIKIVELEKESLNKTLNLLVFSLVFSLALISLIIIYNRRLKKNNEQLFAKNKQIEEALLTGQTIERKRMASELHDNISNKVLGLKMRMETLETENLSIQARENYQSTIKFIDEVYSDIRLISHNLLPEELENKGLMVALENLVKKLNLMGKTNFDIQIDIPNTRYTPRLEYEVYSVVLELVNNILKHSKAPNAVILILEENNFLKILIKDNGVGFRKDAAEDSGFGIKNVKSRIESLRGTLEIINIEGTEIRIDVPTY